MFYLTLASNFIKVKGFGVNPVGIISFVIAEARQYIRLEVRFLV
jgi:hypothetical protein